MKLKDFWPKTREAAVLMYEEVAGHYGQSKSTIRKHTAKLALRKADKLKTAPNWERVVLEPLSKFEDR